MKTPRAFERVPIADRLTLARRQSRPWETLTAALAHLAEANRMACEAACDPWEFAVELDELARLGASRNDLRWLLARGFAQHADELDSQDCGARRFSATMSWSISSRACFVATDAGLAWVMNRLEQHASPEDDAGSPHLNDSSTLDERGRCATDLHPFYDAMRHELRFGDQIVKRFRCPAPNQQLILAEFQAKKWVRRIDDPLPVSAKICPKRRLNESIRALNRHQLGAFVRFSGDGTGRGVLWSV